LPCLHLPPINLVVSQGSYPVSPVGDLILGRASHLDAFSGYPFQTWLPSDAPGGTAGTPEVCPRPVLSYWERLPSSHLRPQRIETDLSHDGLNPARGSLLIGEQPNPWDLIQPQDVMSRHRGAEPGRLCELLGPTSLLSPG